MRNVIPFAVLLLSCKTPPAAPSEDPAVGIKAAMDLAVDPCQDFYAYACGGWLASTPLPADRPAYFRSFHTIVDQNQKLLHDIVDAAVERPGDDPRRQRIGSFFGACMDETAIDAKGLAPIASMLQEVETIRDLSDVMRVVGRSQLQPGGALFGLQAFADLSNPDVYVGHLGQASLGLPDRDYYLKADEAGQLLLTDYEAHVARLLGLAGTSQEVAAQNAKVLVAFEAALAQIQWSKEELRETDKQNHPVDRAGFQAIAPNLPLDSFFEGAGYPSMVRLNVLTPSFFTALDGLVKDTPVDTLKVALRYSLLRHAAPGLSGAVQKEVFDFHQTRLQGTAVMQPRWKRCLSATESALANDVGQLYVEAAFAGDSGDVALDLIRRIETAFEERLPALSWMDDATRAVAADKARAVTNKIGHPSVWIDYSALSLSPDDHFGNWTHGLAFEARRQLDRVGGPVDPTEWMMSPQQVNAYYNPSENEIVFPAGILQPPFFSSSFPMAVNLGAIGMVMGHELTHGFDDEGRKFDKDGRLVEWWAPDVSARFEERAQCLAKEYSGFEVDPGVHVNGELTLGENIADLGGYRLALTALATWEAENGASAEFAGLDGRQQLFVGAAQAWCAVSTPGYRQMQVRADPHAAARFRVVGPVMNLVDFREAFNCPVGTPMAPENVCEIW